MTTADHVIKATRTLPDLGSEKLNLAHMVMGLASELGEIVNCTGTELKQKVDKINLEEELGDMYWYLSCYSHLRGLPVPDGNTLKINIPVDKCFELLITSVSELTDIVKKYVAYNKDIVRAKELDTVYDIYVSLKLFEDLYQLPGHKVRERNINKLRVRYPEKYSDEQAINRDTLKERVELERNNENAKQYLDNGARCIG